MPGTITALVVQKKNKERVNVYLDNEFAFGLAIIEAIKLHKGQNLSDEDIAKLKSLDEIEQAVEQCINLLSYRPRSIKEVRVKLGQSQRQYPEVAIDFAIERLTRSGLLNDVEFARFWIENRDRFKPRAVRALRYELRQKGVEDRIIDEALSELDEDDACYRAAQKKARSYRRLDQQAFNKKMNGYLARRGFSYSVIRDVLTKIWEEREFQIDPEDPNA